MPDTPDPINHLEVAEALESNMEALAMAKQAMDKSLTDLNARTIELADAKGKVTELETKLASVPTPNPVIPADMAKQAAEALAASELIRGSEIDEASARMQSDPASLCTLVTKLAKSIPAPLATESGTNIKRAKEKSTDTLRPWY